MNNLYTYLRDKYAIYALSLGTADYTPGRLLETYWQPKFPGAPPKPSFRSQIGFAWEYLGMDADAGTQAYPTALIDASIIVENVTDNFTLDAGLGLPQFGLSANTSIQSGVSVNLNISAVKARTFKRGPDSYDILVKLRGLKTTDPAEWAQRINKTFLVTDSYYVSQLTADFHTAGKVSAQETFADAGFQVSANFTLTWNNDHQFTLVGPASVPFAVDGERVDAG